jgi:hypothetical protein
MPFVPVPDTVLAEIRMQQDSQKIENTLYFKGTSLDVPTATTLATALIDWWTANIAPKTHVSLILSSVVITDLSSATGFQVGVAPTTSTHGLITGSDEMPNNVVATISFRTGSRGRSFRGRNYIAGLTNGQITANTLTSTAITDFLDAYNALLAVATAQDVVWVVASRFSGVDPVTHKPIPRTTGITTEITNVLFADDTVDSQRRRLPGRGQ